MSRVYNFSAGPAMLPEVVLKQAQEEFSHLFHKEVEKFIWAKSCFGPKFLEDVVTNWNERTSDMKNPFVVIPLSSQLQSKTGFSLHGFVDLCLRTA